MRTTRSPRAYGSPRRNSRPWTVATSVPSVDLHDPADVADLLRHLRAHLRDDAAATCTSATRPAISAPSCRPTARSSTEPATRTRRGSAASGIRRRTPTASPRPRVQPIRRLHVRLRDGPRDRGVDGAVLGRRVLPPRLLGRLSVLRVGERERLRPLGRHDVFGDAHVVRRRRRRRHDGERQLLQQPHRDVGHLQRRPPVQRVDRQCIARLRPHGQHRRRRVGQRRARQQLQHLYAASAAPDRACQATGAGGSTYQRAGATTAGPQGYAHARRRLDVQRQDRARPTRGIRRASATTTTRTSTATSTRTPAAAGSSIRRVAGVALSGDTSWADRESQARRRRRQFGDQSFGGLGGDRSFGGGGFGGDRSLGRWRRRLGWPLRRRRRIRRRRFPRRRRLPALSSRKSSQTSGRCRYALRIGPIGPPSCFWHTRLNFRDSPNATP